MNNQIMNMPENVAPVQAQNNTLGIFQSNDSFSMAARMADAMSKSTIVPKDYQGNSGNCLIAIDTASRMGISPMMVMQNLYIVNGRPAWSSQWIIAAINASKKYALDLQFEYGYDKEDGGLSCTAWTKTWDGTVVRGPKITKVIAQSEGWIDKNGSKWKTMPEVMISYRAASFFCRRCCPEVTMGIYAEEEAASIPMKNEAPEDITAKTEPEIVGEPKISKTQRESMFKYAEEVIGEGYQDTLKAMIAGLGFNGTKDMTQSAYNTIMEQLDRIMEDMKGGEQ